MSKTNRRVIKFAIYGCVGIFTLATLSYFDLHDGIQRLDIEDIWSSHTYPKFQGILALDERLSPREVGYVFQDPDRYKGPTLAHWPPLHDRNTSIYIRPNENTILSDLSCFDWTGIELLVVVQSAPEFDDRRNSIRQTWMRFAIDNPKIGVVFLFGTMLDNPKRQAAIEVEQEINCDIIQMDFVDDYFNVTLDSISAMKLVMDIPEINPDLLLICDDDIYLFLPTIWHLIADEKIINKDSQYLWGVKIGNGRILRAKNSEPHAVHWEVPFYILQGKTYPDYLSGSAYIVPKNVIPCLYETALTTPIFHINDVFISGYLAKMCKLGLKNTNRFQTFEDSSLANLTPNQVVIHYAKPGFMRVLDHIFRHQGGIFNEDCSKPNTYCQRDQSLHFCDHLQCRPFLLA